MPLIIAHRGASAVAPENTLVAFRRAIQDGADGVECDVRLSGDGVPVLFHDQMLKRTALMSGAMCEFTAAELSKIDVGTWFNLKHPKRARNDYTGETVPTLRCLFEQMRDGDGLIYIELKFDNEDTRELARATAKLVNEFCFADRVVIKSFEHDALAEIKLVAPNIRTAALFTPRPLRVLHPKRGLVIPALDVGADELSLHVSLATRRIVRKARLANLPTVIWTADNPGWVKRALEIGIYAIITNNPARLIARREELRRAINGLRIY